MMPPAATCAAVAAGSVLAWYGSTALMPLSLLFPAIAMTRSSRFAAAAVALSYYGAASWPLVRLASVYLGIGIFVPILLWAVAATSLAAPWACLWTANRVQLLWRVPVAFVLSTIPPLGIIGWASPLSAAGVLFPGSEWIGLALVMIIPAVFALKPLMTSVAVLALASALHVQAPSIHRLSSNWEGIDTAFGNPARPPEPVATLRAAELIQRTALESRARVVVFPEMVVPRWTEATEAFWDDSIHQLLCQGRTMLVGAGIPAGDGSGGYANAVVIKGSDAAPPVHQGVPVPIAMWKPWTKNDSVPLRPFGKRMITLAGERAAVFVCYEQLLPLPFVTAMFEQPTVLVGVSNAFWTSGTVVPKVQRAALGSWSRLFSLPVLSATNS
jgi:hypothetical protein